jgi:hypothetical protein
MHVLYFVDGWLQNQKQDSGAVQSATTPSLQGTGKKKRKKKEKKKRNLACQLPT